MWTSRKCPNHPCPTALFPCIPLILKKRKEDYPDTKRKKEGVNVVIPFVPSADNSNLSADGEDSFISVDMDSAMPSPFSEVRMYETTRLHFLTGLNSVILNCRGHGVRKNYCTVPVCNDFFSWWVHKTIMWELSKEWMISIELLCHCQHTSSHLLATLISCRSSYSHPSSGPAVIPLWCCPSVPVSPPELCVPADLVEQWAPAQLHSCRRKQQRHAGNCGRTCVFCSTVPCHQLSRFHHRLCVWHDEWWVPCFNSC